MLEETQDHEEIIERVAVLDIGKAEVSGLCAGVQCPGRAVVAGGRVRRGGENVL